MNCTQFAEQAIANLKLLQYLEVQVNTFVNSPSPSRSIKTPQRKARLHDKQRIRLKDVKSWALKRSDCKDTAEIKKYLKILNISLDLRYTSAWIAINKELAEKIKQIKPMGCIETPDMKRTPLECREPAENLPHETQLKTVVTFAVGDSFEWTMEDFGKRRIDETLRGYKPLEAHICAWFPLVITAISGNEA